MFYLQSRYYDPEMGRFINADSSISTGQGLLGNNMFAYCLNNPVNGCDPCGTCFHHWKIFDECEECEGKTFGEKVESAWEDFTTWCEDTYDHINGVYQQQQQLNTEMLMQQNEMIGNGAKAAWDAYNQSVALENEMIYQQAALTNDFIADRFSTYQKTANTLIFVGSGIQFGFSAHAIYAAAVAGNSVGGPVGGALAAGIVFLGSFFAILAEEV